MRQNLWDDEDRLRAVDLNPEESQPHPLAVYTYDAAGQRIVRYIPGRVDAKSNAHAVSMNETDEIMIYPNGLVSAKVRTTPGVAPSERNTVTSYTKHYYIGASRVSSAIGTTITLGLFPKPMTGAFPGIQTAAATTVTKATQALQETYAAMGQNLTLAQPTIEGEVTNHFHTLVYDAYFYHSDHLGSSNYITNLAGDVTQHMEYLPFGELLVDEHLNSYNTPFKFNAKEFDAETGNYYYGARYYDPKFSVWLSVDPLVEKTFDAYGYCYQNPIRYIDPTGMEGEDPDPPQGTYLIVHGAGWDNPYTKTSNQGDNFKKNAEQRKQQLLDSGVPDSSIILISAYTEEEFLSAVNTTYDSGKIIELDVYAHGASNTINFGGYETDKEEENKNYRLLFTSEVSKINSDNFSADSKVTLWGCNMGRVVEERDPIAQKMADHLNLGGNNQVRAFDNYSEHKTRGGDGRIIIYDGTMIRSRDRKNQKVNLTTFKPK